MLVDPRDRRLATGPARRPVLPALPPDGALAELALGFTTAMQTYEAEDSELARDRMLGEAIQPYLDRYEQETGERLGNPYERPPADLFGLLPASWGDGPSPRKRQLAKVRERYAKAREQPGDRLVSQLPELPDDAGLTREAVRRALTVAERAERQALLSTSAAGTVGRLAGTMTGAIKDPTNLATLFAGAGAASGYWRTFLVEAGLGGSAELVMSPKVAAWKAELGKEHGLGEIATNVALGALTAGTFGVALKGAGAGARRLWRLLPQRARDAATVLDSLDTVERRNPFDEARRRLNPGRGVDASPRPAPPVRRPGDQARTGGAGAIRFTQPTTGELAAAAAGKAGEAPGAGERSAAAAGPRPTQPTAAAAGARRFKTALGSTYAVNGQSTTRTKSLHPGHLPTDVGQKRPSEVTYYVSSEDAPRLGIHGSLTGRKALIVRGSQIIPVAWNDAAGRWGVSPSDKPVTFTTTPEVGRAPIELWGGGDDAAGRAYSSWHAGNEIVDVEGQTASLDGGPREAALHRAALLEAEDAVAAGRAPDGPAIREIDRLLPDLDQRARATTAVERAASNEGGKIDTPREALSGEVLPPGSIDDEPPGSISEDDLDDLVRLDEMARRFEREHGISLDDARELREEERDLLYRSLTPQDLQQLHDLLAPIAEALAPRGAERAIREIDRLLPDLDQRARANTEVERAASNEGGEIDTPREARIAAAAIRGLTRKAAQSETNPPLSTAGESRATPAAGEPPIVASTEPPAASVRRKSTDFPGLADDDEAFAREVMGDEAVDEALEELDGRGPWPGEPDALDRPVVPPADEAGRITLAALREELGAGDFEVLDDQLDEATGQVVQVRRSAREVWHETEATDAAWREAAGCMIGGAADGA